MINTGDIAGIIILGCSILWAGYFLFWGKKAGKPRITEDEVSENNNSIVGMSKTRLGQYTNNNVRGNGNKYGVVPSKEMEQVFYTQEEARLNIDVDMGTLSPLNDGMDEEDLLLLHDTELVPVLATGASFDELAEMSDLIQSHLHGLSQTHIVKAAKTIKKVVNTSLMGQLLNQVSNGEQKVADILDLCDAELAGQVKTQTNIDDLDGSDLDAYL